MKKIVFLFITFFMISACGSADDFFEDLEKSGDIDSIQVISPSDSTNINPTDTITVVKKDTVVVRNDTIITPKDTTIVPKDSTIVDDTLITSNSPEIELKKLFAIKSKSSKSNQGLAIFGDELFNFHDSNNVIDIYNIKTYQIVASIEIEPESNAHCNTVSFSSEYYSIEDKYPLIYAQQAGGQNKVNVYRIINKDSTFYAEKIQTISLLPCTHSLTAIDVEKKQLCVIYANKGRYVTMIDLPKSSPNEIALNLNKGIKTYAVKIPKVVQDTAFDNGCLYFICGYSKEGELWKIDFEAKTAKIIDLTKYGLNAEPEGLDVYEGKIILSFINNNVYQIIIND